MTEKNGTLPLLLMLTLLANANVPAAAVFNFRPADDFMNLDTVSLSLPTSLGPPQLICAAKMVISAVVKDRKYQNPLLRTG